MEEEQKLLWEALCMIVVGCKEKIWMVLGDFNEMVSAHERQEADVRNDSDLADFW